MASVLHRTTKQFLQSANTPDHPTADWIINPDMSAVDGQPSKYWIITGDVVTLADQSTRDAIDSALLSASRDDTVAQLDEEEDVLRAFMLVVLDEINTLRTLHSLSERTVAQMKTGIRNKLGS